MTKRLLQLQCVLLAGLGSVFLLPRHADDGPSGIALTLPDVVDMWIADDVEVSQKEREMLASDTQFARRLYTSPEGDQIYVSIVLSGEDMSNSIHRPERCLPAQGWNLVSSDSQLLPIGPAKTLPLTRLSSVQMFSAGNHQQILIRNLTYYWFIGYHTITASHLARTAADLRDRLLHGYNQHWAYVTVSAIITKGVRRPERTDEQTVQILERFIEKLTPNLKRPDGTALF